MLTVGVFIQSYFRSPVWIWTEHTYINYKTYRNHTFLYCEVLTSVQEKCLDINKSKRRNSTIYQHAYVDRINGSHQGLPTMRSVPVWGLHVVRHKLWYDRGRPLYIITQYCTPFKWYKIWQTTYYCTIHVKHLSRSTLAKFFKLAKNLCSIDRFIEVHSKSCGITEFTVSEWNHAPCFQTCISICKSLGYKCFPVT